MEPVPITVTKMKDTPPTTIRDVARKAKVGVGTVSRVLNDNPSVSEKTREKVLTAIEELDYTPNPIARQLSVGRTLTIGIILPYLTLPSYIERLRGVQHVLASSEYDLVIFCVDDPAQKNAYFQDLSRKSRVDGMLIVSLPPDDFQADYFTRSGIPTVLIDSDHSKLCCVVADDIEGGRMATRYLIELGHRKIAYLTDYLETPFHPAMSYRYQGYRSALEEVEIPYNPDYFMQGERDRESARALAKKLLSLDDPPSAVFAASDARALGILEAAQEMKIKVPSELSVIGYDAIRESAYYNLTTIDQSLFDSGVMGTQMLFDLLTNRAQPPCKKHVPLKLLARSTTAPPP
ncbi:MAG TPA: LacI family transcriptional regulator [Chloroflexi bacterium]|nr:LacI family transcriptional regulator [Chloroflexota bacterium]HBY07338.1 LacI family transcriptional regulator [Chloroflexota bacterium]